MSFGRLAFGQN